MCGVQVWTTNAFSGFIGVFNLQGSSWDRKQRQFRTHDAYPPPLTAQCRPTDIETLPELQAAVPAPASGRCATLTHGTSSLQLCGVWDPVAMTVLTASADLITVVPTSHYGGVEFAPLGVASMLNIGGSVTHWTAGHRSSDSADLPSSNGTDGSSCHNVTMRGEGVFVAYASEAPASIIVDGTVRDSSTWSFNVSTGRVEVEVFAAESVESVIHQLCFVFALRKA